MAGPPPAAGLAPRSRSPAAVLGLLQPRRARDDDSYRLASDLSEIAAKDEAPSSPASVLPERILEALGETDSASREELQEATGASRSSVINALDHLITSGTVEPPPRPAALTGVIGAYGHSQQPALKIADCERSFQVTAATPFPAAESLHRASHNAQVVAHGLISASVRHQVGRWAEAGAGAFMAASVMVRAVRTTLVIAS